MLPTPARGPANHHSEHQSRNSAALLLVEQDDGLRRFLFWTLYLEEFKVLTARDTNDALRLSRDIAGPVELLIIGSLPPGSSAAELQQQIESERSEVRTILLDELTGPDGHGGGERSSLARSGMGESVEAGTLIQRIKKMISDRRAG